MEFDLRKIKKAEFEDFVSAAGRGFSEHSTEHHLRHAEALIDLDRAIAAFDGADVVGTAVASSFDMTVPGGSLPTAGVAFVTVQPTHRRRGILRNMMTHQLKDFHERGEPLAALWASESIIYGRFGYGMATFNERWSIDKRHTAFLHAPEQRGRLRFVNTDEARKLFPGVYERVRSKRNAMIARTDAMWNEEFGDPEIIRRGGTAYFFVVYERDGEVDGYVKYRIHNSDRKVIVYELMAATDEAYAGLWKFCFGIDLQEHVDAFNRPVDEPLIWMLADPRRLQRRVGDAMWIRLVDVQASLSSRSYSQEGRIVFDIRDDVCAWNNHHFELQAGQDGAECRPTQSAPDISLSVSDMAAIYLGATPLSTLFHAGRIHEKTPGAVHLADAMFRTERQPWPAHDF